MPEAEAVQSLRDGGFGDKEIDAALEMAAKVREVYPNEEYLAHEVLFEAPIPDSPHSMVGRIDSILRRGEAVLISDWKTSKYRTKTDRANKAADYCRSNQVGFYILGAQALGFKPIGFIYRLVSAGSGAASSGVQVTEHETNRTPLELKTLQRSVHQTCELITWMKATFGIENSWPSLPSLFDQDYAAITGRKMFVDYMPDGFAPKVEHLELLKEEAIG
jgi:hypothetical protein